MLTSEIPNVHACCPIMRGVSNDRVYHPVRSWTPTGNLACSKWQQWKTFMSRPATNQNIRGTSLAKLATQVPMLDGSVAQDSNAHKKKDLYPITCGKKDPFSMMIQAGHCLQSHNPGPVRHFASTLPATFFRVFCL